MARFTFPKRRQPKVAFVLSGGGNLGALQVGMLRALVERNIVPDLVLGCSVGSVNGVRFASKPDGSSVDALEALWLDIDGDELMEGTGFLPGAVQLARKGQSLHSNDGLRRLCQSNLIYETFEELEVPFQCVATAVSNASETWFSTGPLLEPVLASAALPVVYPAVTIDGVRYIDGAVVTDVPIRRAVELGATRIYVLHVGSYDRPREVPRRPIDAGFQAYWMARQQRYADELAHLPPNVTAIMLPTGPQPPTRYNDFTRSSEWISQSYELASRHLDRIEVTAPW